MVNLSANVSENNWLNQIPHTSSGVGVVAGSHVAEISITSLLVPSALWSPTVLDLWFGFLK